MNDPLQRRLAPLSTAPAGGPASLAEVLEALDEAVLVLDAQRRVVHRNERFNRFWRIPEATDDLFARMAERLTEPRRLDQYLPPPGERRVDVLELRSGRELACTVAGLGQPGAPAGWVFAMREVESATATHRRSLLLGQMAGVFSQLLRDPAMMRRDAVELSRSACEGVARGLQVARVSVWLLEGKSTREMRCRALYELAEDRHSHGATLKADDYPRYFAALASGFNIVAHDAENDPCTREFTEGYLRPLGITSMLDSPLKVGGRVVGVLCLEHIGPCREWRLEDALLSGLIADLIAVQLAPQPGADPTDTWRLG